MKFALAILLVICLILGGANVFFFLKDSDLNSQLTEAKDLFSEIQDELVQAQAENKELAEERENLRADAISYVNLSTKVQQEKEKIQGGLEKAQKLLELKEAEIERKEQLLKELREKVAENGKLDEVVKRNEELQEEVKSLKETSKKEKQVYYYNLGVAYTQAKYYKEAVGAYQKSLELQPSNADAHYNLGVLHETIMKDSDKAASHYRDYLRLKPEAKDKEEVEVRLKELES